MSGARALCCALLALAPSVGARGAPPAAAQLEITTLLRDVGTSGCEFYRNGTWYDAKRAQAHLDMKYRDLARRDQIATAEDFITRAATRSSLSGQAYQIRCPGNAVEPSDQWLRDRLLRNRARSAAGITRTTPLAKPAGQERTISRLS